MLIKFNLETDHCSVKVDQISIFETQCQTHLRLIGTKNTIWKRNIYTCNWRDVQWTGFENLVEFKEIRGINGSLVTPKNDIFVALKTEDNKDFKKEIGHYPPFIKVNIQPYMWNKLLKVPLLFHCFSRVTWTEITDPKPKKPKTNTKPTVWFSIFQKTDFGLVSFC